MNNDASRAADKHNEVRDQNPVYQPPPLPLKVFLGARSSGNDRQRALYSEAESSGPYKPVPLPKPLVNPPPYRQPPQPAGNSAGPETLPGSTVGLFSRLNQSEPSLVPSSQSSPSEALLAYSSKFPIDKEVVVATGDKVAEVSRIQAAANNQDPEHRMFTRNSMNGGLVQPLGANQSFPDIPDRMPMDELRRPASYVPVHVHFSGWPPQEANYVPMHYAGAAAESSPHQHNVATNSSSNNNINNNNNNKMDQHHDQALSHYEIRIDNTDKHNSPVTVAQAWQSAADSNDTSTFDRLRDACNKMFTRDGNLRSSAHLPMSPQQARQVESAAINEASVGIPTRDTEPQNLEEPKEETESKSNSLGRKLAGKTYHSIKDMFKISTSKGSSKSTEAQTSKSPGPVRSSGARASDSVHAINQRIHSQLQQQQQQKQQQQQPKQPQQSSGSVWGSYSRPPVSPQYSEQLADPENRVPSHMKAPGSQSFETTLSSEPDTSALARLSLNQRQESFSRTPKPPQSQGQGHATSLTNSPFSVRHPKPSVTFRMDLNEYESQYDSYAQGHTHTQGQPQGQVVLYDDTMHFPSLGSDSNKRSYSEAAADSSWSSIQSPGFTYGDYDVPPSSKSNGYPGAAADGSSSGHQSAASNSDVDKRSGQSGSTSDSGLGVQDGAQRNRALAYQRALDTSTESDKIPHKPDWLPAQMNQSSNDNGRCNTPPLPPLSPDNSPLCSPQLQRTYSASSKPDLLEPASPAGPVLMKNGPVTKASLTGAAIQRSSSVGQSELFQKMTAPAADGRTHRKQQEEDKVKNPKLTAFFKGRSNSTKSLGAMHSLTALQEALDLGEITSLTSTGLDLEGDSDCSSSHSEGDFNSTAETSDSRALRKQLEGLETMYFEVLKTLNKKGGKMPSSGDYKLQKRRPYGSMSSLPSSISSRPVYRDRKRGEDRVKRSREKSSNKRFQRLESHVVTLARSVAHLSSEMRTQHMMIQELESIRNDISALKNTPFRQPGGFAQNRAVRGPRDDFEAWQGTIPALTDPSRVKKLTSFFGDEPPLLRIFLKKLGYEKYAPLFEQEKIGMIELPYVTEDRLQKMGIPMGPRIRILQESQIAYRQDVNTFYIV